MRSDLSNCRLIFGEADGLPGLTVDKFSNIIVVQILSYGIEIRKNLIFNSLLEILTEYGEKIDGIYERNDVAIRKLEGLEENKKWYFRSNEWDEDNNITYITENGIKYEVDFFNGQKTGFFLDQKFNRAAVAKLSKGKKVLDCFTHTGSFALNAAYGGAEKVTAVDISQHAIDTAKRNAVRNNLDSKIEFIVDDVFDLLTDKIKKNEYDFIILDPPAFTKSRKTILNAKRGYGEINYRAMKLLPRGGYLATCSCSHFMEDKLFVKMLKESAANAQVQLKQIEAKQQSPDHPILWNVPETDYLKFYIFQII
jgi:23S rRNA (cytosine1962-C5)-methyltransferase